MKNVSRIFGLALACTGLAFAASTVKVDLSKEYQVIRGFGGMVHNTWQGGAGLSDADASLAFGTGDGHIGLNTLRIPVNGNSNDFGKEVAAAKSAKKYAGNDFILYATPWTSQYAGANQHIAASNYQAYTDHLNSFAKYMKNQGIPLYAISISNEPDWCHEWTCWSADEIYNYARDYAGKLRENGTKVISNESFAYRKDLYNKVLNDANVLKNWDILGAHFYASEAYTEDSWFQYPLADQKNVERWMTEHYTESDGSANYWRKVMVTGDQATQAKLDTVRAMDVAYDIHRALAVGNFSQYTWWYVRRCYGLIMEKDFGNKLQVPTNEIGKISKRGYIMSQFARFIRPGAVRVDATMKPEANVFASAYKSADGDSTIVVLLNRDFKNAKEITVNVSGANIESFHVYTTSEAKNAKYEGEVVVKNGSVTVKMESGATNKDCIVTLVGVGPQVIVPQEPYKGSAVALPGKIEMENFDIPGSGKGNDSYYDKDSENSACKADYAKKDTECTDFRSETGVDIKKGATGYVIGWNEAGEWLEYTINVKEAGDYTMYAAVSTDNKDASFQLLLDGVALTDTIHANEAAKEEGQSFEDFGKVKRNVKIEKAGEHVLRFLVTGSWLDIDYINFVAGKDAEDTDPIEEITEDPEDPTAIFNVRFNASKAPSTAHVFSLNGKMVTTIKLNNVHEAASELKNAGVQPGVYMIRMKGAKSFMVNTAK